MKRTELKTAPVTPAISGGVFKKIAILLFVYVSMVPLEPL